MPPALSAGSDASGLLQGLQRRWLLALTVGMLLAAGAGAAAWFVLSGNYTAFAQVHIAASQPWVVFANNSEGKSDFQFYQQTQAARIRSRYVLTAALKRDEVKKLEVINRESDPAAWLEHELKVELKEGSEIITVSMKGSEPEELLTLVDAVTKAYLQEVVHVEAERRARRVSELTDLYDKSKERLRAKRTTLHNLANQLGTGDTQALTQKQIVLLNSFGELKKQHQAISYELMKARGKLTAYSNRAQTEPDHALPETAIMAAVEADGLAKQYLSRIARLQEIITDYELNAVNQNENSLVRARQQVAAAQKALAARRQEIRLDLREQSRVTAGSHEDNALSALQDEVAILNLQEKSLKTEVDRMASEAERIGTTSTEHAMLRTEIKQEEDVNEKIGNALEAAKVEVRFQPRVTLFQDAALQIRDPKRQILATAMASLGTLVGFGLCVGYVESRSRRIQTVGEVAAGLRMRVMGSVPPLPNSGQQQLIGTSDAYHEAFGPGFVESIDAVRTVLLRDAHTAGMRTVMVTSAVEGEGKTTLASHLASSLARAGRRTLLIDCDLRRPAVHHLFELPAEPGFSEILRGAVTAAEAVQPTPVPGLYFLAAGAYDQEVWQALARDGAHAVFAHLREQYDFIVVDSHPVLSANDSLMIGQQADAVIFSILRDRSQSHVVYAAYQRLQALGIRMLGAVVSGIKNEDMYGRGYQYGLPAPRL